MNAQDECNVGDLPLDAEFTTRQVLMDVACVETQGATHIAMTADKPSRSLGVATTHQADKPATDGRRGRHGTTTQR